MYSSTFSQKMLQNETYMRFVRYTLVGLVALIINLFLVHFFYVVFHMHYLTASCFAFFLETGVAFLIHRKWTFHSKKSLGKGYLHSLMIGFYALVIILIITYVMVDYLAVQYIWARTASTIVAGLLTYTMDLRITFKI